MSPTRRLARVVPLRLLSTSPVPRCDELRIGWVLGDSVTPLDAQVEVVLIDGVASLSQSASTVSNATPAQSLGQARLSDQQFRWAKADVAPGTYIIDATADSSKILIFSPTSPFVISDSSSDCQPSSSSTPHNDALFLATPDSESGPSAGLIAGVVIAALVVVFIVLLAAWYYRRKRRRAPVALRPRTPLTLPSGATRAQISPAPTPIPVLSMSPPLPAAPRSPTMHDVPQSPFALQPGVFSQPATTYAESIAVSDDSFAEERDMLREEFLDAATSVGHGRAGRPFTSRESSVWSDLPVGPDGMALQMEAGKKKATKSLTFAISNPDNTVWEEDEQRTTRVGPSRS